MTTTNNSTNNSTTTTANNLWSENLAALSRHIIDRTTAANISLPHHVPVQALRQWIEPISTAHRIVHWIDTHLPASYVSLGGYAGAINVRAANVGVDSISAEQSAIMLEPIYDATADKTVWRCTATNDAIAQRFIQQFVSALTLQAGLTILAEHDGLKVYDGWIEHCFTLSIISNTDQYYLSAFTDAVCG